MSKPPPRVSNSFFRAELEVLALALRRTADVLAPVALSAEDYAAIEQVLHVALRGGDIGVLVRSQQLRGTLRKIAYLRVRATDLSKIRDDLPARNMVVERVGKMLERARRLDPEGGVIQAGAEEKCG